MCHLQCYRITWDVVLRGRESQNKGPCGRRVCSENLVGEQMPAQYDWHHAALKKSNCFLECSNPCEHSQHALRECLRSEYCWNGCRNWWWVEAVVSEGILGTNCGGRLGCTAGYMIQSTASGGPWVGSNQGGMKKAVSPAVLQAEAPLLVGSLTP